MPDLVNATQHGALALPSVDRDGRDLLLIVVAARFAIPAPQSAEPTPQPLSDQAPPPVADVYWGEPDSSSLMLEGQSAPVRPATDIYIVGAARTPGETPLERMDVRVQVGTCSTHLRVIGDRHWETSPAGGLRPSLPDRFTEMPLTWERAFGGAAETGDRRPVFDARNPVGCGLQVSTSAARDKPVPNLEDPRQLIGSLGDRPVPAGVGPIARSWQPRIEYAGTYDDEWQRSRAPLWPTDFDEMFFCAAPETLQAKPHLRGGEAVRLAGFHPDGEITFQLPVLRLSTRSRFANGEVRRSPVLDGVMIDTLKGELTMYYRAAVPAPLALVRHRETILRNLEPWERPAR